MNTINSGGSTPKCFAIDFFCGAGGTTRGLIDAGVYVVAGIDKDKDCQETYLKNNPNRYWDLRPPEFLQLDIFQKSSRYQSGQQKRLFAELERVYKQARAIDRRIPWLFAICAPCQPFTKLAKKAMTAKRQLRRRRDKNLLGEALKFVRHFKPEMILS
jgi:DNA (cytosine-5)-methyltransferase 1